MITSGIISENDEAKQSNPSGDAHRKLKQKPAIKKSKCFRCEAIEVLNDLQDNLV